LQEESKKDESRKNDILSPNSKFTKSIKNDNLSRVEWVQANLSLIDGMFSLLVSTADHSYEFETNREERIAKKLHSCISAE